ncbi:superoxide dismutase family protein [Ponticaulis profundi]|uniref:Superoxide dismutase [Cu-Zn] n=1 Tax=Ponticaulis profundi TaxID=2665222 RepID=A0ABW1SA20_9PROT
MTSRFLITAASVSALMLSACGEAQTPTTEPETTPPPSETMTPSPEEAMAPEAEGTTSLPSMMNARASIVGDEGEEIGTANILEGPNGVLLRITLNEGALTPGWHGLHLHQKGDCSDTGEFKLSGGHVGKVDGGHGLLNPEGPEGGDIPNIWVAADGSAGYEAFTTLTTGASLMDADGSAIIIHENEDDHMTQPIGGAGARVACGAIE